MDLSTASKKLRESYARIADQKKARSTKLIELYDLPKKQNIQGICQAMNMSGKKCVYKATSDCGRFCKRHSITDSPLTKCFV